MNDVNMILATNNYVFREMWTNLQYNNTDEEKLYLRKACRCRRRSKSNKRQLLVTWGRSCAFPCISRGRWTVSCSWRTDPVRVRTWCAVGAGERSRTRAAWTAGTPLSRWSHAPPPQACSKTHTCTNKQTYKQTSMLTKCADSSSSITCINQNESNDIYMYQCPVPTQPTSNSFISVC